MTPEVRKELDDLLLIASNWIEADVALADCNGTDGFLLEDFIEDISAFILPYARRLHDCHHITDAEFGEFIIELRLKANVLKEKLRLPSDIPCA